MTAATLIGGWMWYTGDLPELHLGPIRIRPLYTVGMLAVTALLCKSSGAIGLGVVGAAVLFLTVTFRTRLFLAAVLLLPAGYVYARVWAGWTGMEMAEVLGEYFDRERSASVIFRLENEKLLIGRAMESPIFGWGGWGRARVYDEEGRDVTVTDGLWILAFGDRGMVGLVSLGAVLALPANRVLRRYPPRLWARAPYGVGAVLAVNLALFFIDGIANAMINPVFLLSAGGLNGLIGTLAEPKTVPGQMTNLLRPKRGARKFAAIPSVGGIP
jgi:O-antigen ligase